MTLGASRQCKRWLPLVFIALVAAACGGADEPEAVIRGADDVQVLDPGEVARIRDGLADQVNDAAPGGAASDDTIPLAEDEEGTPAALFRTFGEFRGCMDSEGQPFRGDPTSDPELQADQGYMDAIIKCATRTNIVQVLQDFATAQANLSPEEIEEQNEAFLVLQRCLEDRGWTIDVSRSASGLIQPTTFEDSEGGIDERDIEQCAAENELGID